MILIMAIESNSVVDLILRAVYELPAEKAAKLLRDNRLGVAGSIGCCPGSELDEYMRHVIPSGTREWSAFRLREFDTDAGERYAVAEGKSLSSVLDDAQRQDPYVYFIYNKNFVIITYFESIFVFSTNLEVVRLISLHIPVGSSMADVDSDWEYEFSVAMKNVYAIARLI